MSQPRQDRYVETEDRDPQASGMLGLSLSTAAAPRSVTRAQIGWSAKPPISERHAFVAQPRLPLGRQRLGAAGFVGAMPADEAALIA
jgi:hypothetical protein